MDMLVVGFLKRFRDAPHCIGFMAMLCLAGGLAIVLAGMFAGLSPVIGQALIIVGAAFAAVAVPTFACGLVAELVIRGGLAATWQLPVCRDTAFTKTSLSRTDRPSSPDIASAESSHSRSDRSNGFRRVAENYHRHQ